MCVCVWEKVNLNNNQIENQASTRDYFFCLSVTVMIKATEFNQ